MASSVKIIILQELTSRQMRNPSYSLRALSRDLGISLTALSGVMNDQRNLSPKNVDKLLHRLSLSPQQIEHVKLNRKEKPDEKIKTEHDHLTLAEDEFRLISDWYCLAILNLAKIKKNQSSPAWIAKRLGIEDEQAREAIDRLCRLGLLEVKNKQMHRTTKPISTTTDIPSTAIRKHHQQNLQLAEHALHHFPVELREFSSVTMPVNPENLSKVKDLLLKTRKKVADLLEDSSASEVYTLSFQLFPLTKNQNPKG